MNYPQNSLAQSNVRGIQSTPTWLSGVTHKASGPRAFLFRRYIYTFLTSSFTLSIAPLTSTSFWFQTCLFVL